MTFRLIPRSRRRAYGQTTDRLHRVGQDGSADVAAAAGGGISADRPRSPAGGDRGAAAGELCIMAGGPADVLDALRPILDHLGRHIVHVGDAPGDGDTAKTLNNLLSATTIWSSIEAVVLGIKAGLAPDRLLA